VNKNRLALRRSAVCDYTEQKLQCGYGGECLQESRRQLVVGDRISQFFLFWFISLTPENFITGFWCWRMWNHALVKATNSLNGSRLIKHVSVRLYFTTL
jgi:hypothetical protein